MDKAQIAKSAVKLGVGLVFSAAIGYVYKAGKLVDAKIDAHFAPEFDIRDTMIPLDVTES